MQLMKEKERGVQRKWKGIGHVGRSVLCLKPLSLSLSLFVLLFFSRLPLSHFRKSSHVQLQPWQKAQNCNPMKTMVSGFGSVSCLVGAFFGSGGGGKLSGSGEWEERAGEWCRRRWLWRLSMWRGRSIGSTLTTL